MIKTMLMFMVVDSTTTDDDVMWVMGDGLHALINNARQNVKDAIQHV
jgi:hypothetical protein